MASFADLQAAFQNAILTGDGAVIDALTESPTDGRDKRLGIYQSAYGMRLVKSMRSSFEFLHRYIGDDLFDEIGAAYVADTPSYYANIRWYGATLPQFLSVREPYSDYPILSELAALERALNDAFDAADDVVLRPEDLASVDPARWQDLVFVATAGSQHLHLETNAYDVWMALKDDEDVPDATPAGTAAHILVWRQDATPMVRPIGTEEAMMWDEAMSGIPFGQLCAMLATFDDADKAASRAAAYLSQWIHAGLLSRADIS